MLNQKDIYFSLDDAREELKKRWNNTELREKIEMELGEHFMSEFKNTPRGVTFRQVCSPDNGFTFFYQGANYVGAKPLVIEYHEDIFTHLNEEKKGLGRLRVKTESDEKKLVDIMDFYANEKKTLAEVTLKTGEKLVDFHHKLFDISGYEIELLNNSKWFHNIGRAKDYYYYFLLHFVAHGVLFETFYFGEDEHKFLNKGDANDFAFTDNVIIPSVSKILEKYNIRPIIVRVYPDNQSQEEDFYWWSYPPSVNKFLIDYAKTNSLLK